MPKAKVNENKSLKSVGFKSVINGVIVYLIVAASTLIMSGLMDKIFARKGFFNDITYAVIQDGGTGAVEQYIKYGNFSTLSGFIAGIFLTSLLIFIVIAEWFNFHKIEDFKTASTAGGVWALTFLVVDLLFGYFYGLVMSLLKFGDYTSFSISNNFGPIFLVFLVFVAVMPTILLFIHKLSVKFAN